MKCATPASAGVSRREPARTYAAMETERAPESRALMTRGPEGSAVRSNIRPMLPESDRRPAECRSAGVAFRERSMPDAYFGRIELIQFWPK